MTGARANHTGLAADPDMASLQQARLYTTKRKQAQETVRFYTGDEGANLVGMRGYYDMRSVCRSLASCGKVAHVVHAAGVYQWREEVTQACYDRLFAAGRGVETGQRCQIRAQSFDDVTVLLH